MPKELNLDFLPPSEKQKLSGLKEGQEIVLNGVKYKVFKRFQTDGKEGAELIPV